MPATPTPVVAGWFTDASDPDGPRLLASRCSTCATLVFPPHATGDDVFCRNPGCSGTEHEPAPLSRRGRVWSYTDAQYQPPAPYVPASDPYRPFALAAVELPEGLVVLGQVADGFGVDDLKVGAEVELVVETLHATDDGDLLTYRWRPVAGGAA